MKRFVFLCAIALLVMAASAYAAKTEITYMAWYNTTESRGGGYSEDLGQVQRVPGRNPRHDDCRQPR